MILLPRVGLAALVALGVCLGATAVPATKKTTVPSAKKKYRSSIGKPAPKTVATKKTPVKTATKKVVTAVHRRVAAPHAPKVSAAVRMEAHEGVFQKVSTGATIPVENAGTLIPFFEQLYRHQKGDIPGPLRILHYGDSHTAADEWTADLRNRFQ